MITLRRSGLRPATVVRLALAGTRTDVLRVLLTAFSAALAALAALSALTVMSVTTPTGIEYGSPPWSQGYTNPLLREPGLRPGVALALLMLTIPVLALAGQCARIGAPARDRRLAAVRMAGATPRQAVTVAAAETGAASVLGALVGLGAWLTLRVVLHRPDAQGRLPLPTDVMPHAAGLAVVVLGLPVVATLAAALMLRRVTLSPFGISRRADRRGRPRPWPGVLVLIGIGAAAVVQPLLEWYGHRDGELPGPVVPFLFFGGTLCAVLGVVLGTGWISFTAGRILHRFARRPATLLAARRLQDDPWNGSRTFAALLACVVFGAGSAGIRAWFEADLQAERIRQRLSDKLAYAEPVPPAPQDRFHIDTMDLVDTAVVIALVVATTGLLVAVAEGVVSRRRTHAALTATGVPRGVLGRALAWQTLTPVLPAALLALCVGTLLARGLGSRGFAPGGPVCPADAVDCVGKGSVVPDVVRPARIPVEELALYGLGTLVLVLAALGVALTITSPVFGCLARTCAGVHICSAMPTSSLKA